MPIILLDVVLIFLSQILSLHKRRFQGIKSNMRSFNHNNNNNDKFSERGTRIVIVGGWSPGPLRHLKRALRSQGCHEIIEPSNLSLFMPPTIPGLWCCHPAVIIMTLMLGATIYFAVTANTTLLLRILIILLALAWCRFLVGVVVRTSIETSIRKIRREGLNADNIDHNRVLIIGFSWGGSIVADMIAKGMVGGENQSSALLIAPTTSLVASVALQEDAASKIAELGLAQNYPTKITVVHGEYDVAFCPHQNRWNNISAVDLEILPDNHMFGMSSSLRALERILLNCIR
jgi:hypothetical protein